jgi:hypothetical protein
MLMCGPSLRGQGMTSIAITLTRQPSLRCCQMWVASWDWTLAVEKVTIPGCWLKGLPKFKVPRFTRTLSQWLNRVIEKGFLLERVEEPRPSDETVRECPDMQDAQVVASCTCVRESQEGALVVREGPARRVMLNVSRAKTC